MKANKEAQFQGFDHFVIGENEELPPPLPEKIKILDTKKFIRTNTTTMNITLERKTTVLTLAEKSHHLSKPTQEIFFHVALSALNGKRRATTVLRWINEFSLFLRTLAPFIGSPICQITLALATFYWSSKSASQQKLLRSFFQYWISLAVPGISVDLKNYLAVTKAPKPRSTIEIQNANANERPFTLDQVRLMLSRIDQLYSEKTFSPQDFLLWKLLISEALRPGQLELLRVGDVRFESFVNGNPARTFLSIAITKQAGTPSRAYMREYKVSAAVGQALHDHLKFLATISVTLPSEQPLFCVCRKGRHGGYFIQAKSLSAIGQITRTRSLISREITDITDLDLFTRRFKHTKLTQLAMLGASLDVLAYAGFQTSTISLRHYVNLNNEAYELYESQLFDFHQSLLDAFSGKIVVRANATFNDPEHVICDSDLEADVGACSTSPCTVNAPVGCYKCPRFEAFTDGAHQTVLASLLGGRIKRESMGLSMESITRDDHIIAAVKYVIAKVGDLKNDE